MPYQISQNFLTSRKVLLARAGFLCSLFVLAWFWSWQGPTLCVFHRLTGLQDPGCGMTRAFHQLSHGHLSTALEYNLLAPALFFLLLLVLLLDLLELVTGISLLARIPPWALTAGALMSLIVAIGYGVLRNLTTLP